MLQRNQSLDALRGFAILTMILSGSIAFGDTLPAWMYHAQVPPPDHTFIETVVGITWVDLVFPFFLFSMGAAIPLALNKQVKNRSSFLPVIWIALRRFLLLAFFALFLEHMKAWVIAEQPLVRENLLSMFAFALLFFQFYENKNERYKKLFIGLKISSFIIANALLYFLRFRGEAFSFTKSDIIIMVLANMAFFGTIIWWLTKNNMLLRIGILPFVMAVFFASKETGDGWIKDIYNFSHIGMFKFNWLYQFYFLKYLFIIIPGTIAGDFLLKDHHVNLLATKITTEKKFTFLIALISFALVVSNTVFLFTRQLEINLVSSIALLSMLFYCLSKIATDKNHLLIKFFSAGAYLLLLGLFFEVYEGGIRKDHSTYSYYFVTSGLAFFILIGFSTLTPFKIGNAINNYLSLNGRNPMLAYVAGSLLLMPILQLTGANTVFDSMNSNAWLGFLKGVLFTGIVSLITIFCTKRGWFWKT
ncbi:MAG: DUF5009 domain-containing protein [Ferruginibacter sp.]|nr:DUF5009 domain-containing protein [Ferruginibacter sp.]